MKITLLFTLILLPTIVLGSTQGRDAAINYGAVCLGTTAGATACVACSPCGSGCSIAGLSILGGQAALCATTVGYDAYKKGNCACKKSSFKKPTISFPNITVNPFHKTDKGTPTITTTGDNIGPVNIDFTITAQPQK
ncbi:MAG: hypothetical protein ACXWL5_02330 [Candidatus Chromulinivorax sp.]